MQPPLTKGEIKDPTAGLTHDSLSLIFATQPVGQLSFVVCQSSMLSDQSDDAEEATERLILEYGPGDSLSGFASRHFVLQELDGLRSVGMSFPGHVSRDLRIRNIGPEQINIIKLERPEQQVLGP